MKKIVAAVVVLVLALLLVVAPWGIGVLAVKRVNSGLDQVVETAPYLSIVDRKFTRGWFTSEQEVTFEVLGPWLRALNGKTVADAVAAAQSAETPGEVPPVETPAVETPPEEAIGAGAPDAIASEAAPLPAPEAAPALPVTPVKFTVRNHIVHGPILWFSALGVARVDSTLVIPENMRVEMVKLFGEEPPVEVSTRVRFFGGGTTTFSGEGREIKIDGKPQTLSYDSFSLKVGYSAHLDDIDADGRWPRFEIKDGANGENFLLTGMSLTGTSHRVRGDIYGGDFKLSIDRSHFVGADKAVTDIADLHYIVASTIDDDFMDIALKFGSGEIESKELQTLGLKLEAVHYDFTLRRLHLETMARMTAALKAAYSKPVTSAADVDAAITAPFKEYGLELLKHDPELVIDRVGASTPDGDAYLKGIIRLKGVNEQDLAMGAMGMIGKLDADITVQMAQSLTRKIPGGEAGLATALDQGYVKLEGKNVVSHIEFRNGSLKINGKEQGIPGVGGPPQPPPPQE